VLFSPYVDVEGTPHIRQTKAGFSGTWEIIDSLPSKKPVPDFEPKPDSNPNGITFKHLTPGTRKLLVHGTYGGNAKDGGVMTIKLQAGDNLVNVYLK
jgi:hypothetical protein